MYLASEKRFHRYFFFLLSDRFSKHDKQPVTKTIRAEPTGGNITQ